MDTHHGLAEALQERLARVARPIEQADGLPNAAYADPAFFAAERDRIFRSQWACAGFGKDVPATGDMRPVEFLGQPLLLVRDDEGAVRVYLNVFRHRGMRLVDRPAHASTVRCPYHGWCYGLDGRLTRTPHVGGQGVHTHPRIERSERGLIEVRSATFLDMVFVNLDGTAAPFDAYIAPLAARWPAHAAATLHHGGADSSFALTVETNWKLAVENYCESYHLPFVHPALNRYSKLRDHYHIEAPGTFSGQGTRVYRPQLDAEGRRFDQFAGLGPEWTEGAEYVALYPNVLLGAHNDHYYTIRLDPVSPTRTVEEVEIYYASDAMRDEPVAALRAANAAMWRAVFEEDVGVVEGMQHGRRADRFDGGVFSPVMEGPTHCFHRWVAERMLDRPTEAGRDAAE